MSRYVASDYYNRKYNTSWWLWYDYWNRTSFNNVFRIIKREPFLKCAGVELKNRQNEGKRERELKNALSDSEERKAAICIKRITTRVPRRCNLVSRYTTRDEGWRKYKKKEEFFSLFCLVEFEREEWKKDHQKVNRNEREKRRENTFNGIIIPEQGGNPESRLKLR